MQNFNPYQAPQSAFDETSTESDDRSGPWRDGPDLATLRDARLPGRCVKCNAPGQARLQKTYYWQSAWWLLLVLLNLLLFLIVSLVVRKKCTLQSTLCELHAQRRSRLIVGALSCLGACVLSLIAAAMNDSGPLFALSGALLLASIVVAVIVGRMLYAKRITERYARFGGAGAEFLAGLPRFRSGDA